MKQWWIIAFRNVLKNRRRSLVTLLAVSVGFAAVGLFRGYTAYTYQGLRQSAIQGEGLGHLTVYKKGWLENGGNDPGRLMLTAEEIETIITVAKRDPRVVLVTPQILVSGLVSNGRSSRVFLAQGVIPADYRIIAGPMGRRRPITGEDLSETEPYRVLMARDLARHLNLTPGADAVIMASTFEGQMNALDIRISGTYDTGADATNDKYLLLSYAHAQALYDTDHADRMVVFLNDWRDTEAVAGELIASLRSAGLSCEIRTWNELSVFYGKVKSMFDMIFLFIFQIVFIIVVMSTINTMGMSVVERTREIGTLRVLGVKRQGVNLLFALEGAVLGLLGSVGGMILTVAGWTAVWLIAPTYTPPGSSAPVPLMVELLPFTLLRLMMFLTFLSMAAAVWPARRAARMGIVDALGHI